MKKDRNIVVFVSPKHASHVGGNAYPQLGILSLASYVNQHTPLEAVYLDEAAAPVGFVLQYIRENHARICAVGIADPI